MNNNDNEIVWLMSWYKKNCNDDWEHYHGIYINSTDNPGWSITIDIEGTLYNVDEVKWKFVEHSEIDWFGYKVENNRFYGSGDPSKLGFLINVFKRLIENS